jgi:ABC-2 type transport system ATP-binding protein
MHANLYGVPPDTARKRINTLLKLVELDQRADNLLRTYSGGMRRRLEIARGLIHYPRVLFLDEPTIGLDPQTREHIWAYIKKLSKEEDISIILTTHYMDEADLLCDRIGIIDFGKIVALDTPENLKESLEEETISIATSDAAKLSQRLKETKLVSKAAISNNELTVHVHNGHETLPRIVEVAASTGIHVNSISLHEPNLGDVFLHYTGRAIREEESKEYHGMTAARRRRIR